MGFAFKRRESVAEGIARLGCEAVENALKRCSEDRLEAIHATRKQIKKIRALLRLAQSGIRTKRFKQALASLREAAQYLAPARDAFVRVETLGQRPQADRQQGGHSSPCEHPRLS